MTSGSMKKKKQSFHWAKGSDGKTTSSIPLVRNEQTVLIQGHGSFWRGSFQLVLYAQASLKLFGDKDGIYLQTFPSTLEDESFILQGKFQQFQLMKEENKREKGGYKKHPAVPYLFLNIYCFSNSQYSGFQQRQDCLLGGILKIAAGGFCCCYNWRMPLAKFSQ